MTEIRVVALVLLLSLGADVGRAAFWYYVRAEVARRLGEQP